MGITGAIGGGSLAIPGLVRTDMQPIMLGLGIIAVALAGLSVVRRLGRTSTLLIVAYANVAVTIGGCAFADATIGRTYTAILVVPALYVGLFFSGRWLVGQLVVTTVCAVAILHVSGLRPLLVVLHTVLVLVAASSTSGAVFVLRRQLQRALRQSRQLATMDPLTELANRRGMEERWPALLERCRRLDMPVGVIVADIDHFKRINDEWGHAAGDSVLKLVANLVASCARPGDLVVRLGGEEIAVVAALGGRPLHALAERLREQVESVGAEHQAYQVTISLGVAWEHPPTYSSREDDERLLVSLISRADELMYAAKRGGRNQVRGLPDSATPVTNLR
jgi:diguanylate cyclase (GGDEF)-like protein